RCVRPGRPGMTEEDDSRRLELVRTAQQPWIDALTDLGGRNTLLYYKDRRAGTLDLAQADPEAPDRFTERGSMRLTRLFQDADLRGMTAQDAADRLYPAAAAAEVPGFEIIPRQVIGTFTYAKLPMVRDMEAAGDLLAESDLVAAVAGDPEAQRLVAAEHPARDDSDAPEDDYSVLDADSSQRHAIDTVLAGQSLVIHGPPGTGKSQTIANLIAALVAH